MLVLGVLTYSFRYLQLRVQSRNLTVFPIKLTKIKQSIWLKIFFNKAIILRVCMQLYNENRILTLSLNQIKSVKKRSISSFFY